MSSNNWRQIDQSFDTQGGVSEKLTESLPSDWLDDNFACKFKDHKFKNWKGRNVTCSLLIRMKINNLDHENMFTILTVTNETS